MPDAAPSEWHCDKHARAAKSLQMCALPPLLSNLLSCSSTVRPICRHFNQASCCGSAPGQSSRPSKALSLSAQQVAALWCPEYIRMASPVDRSHRRALQSLLAVTR